MSHSPMTPGVERILDRALQFALHQQTTELKPDHLFWALMHEETRGSEILQQFGLTFEQFSIAPDQPIPLNLEHSEEPAVLPFGEQAQRILRAAELQAARQGRYAETGSEHLLLGLMIEDADIAQMLSEHGLTLEKLLAVIDEAEGHPNAPVSVDFEISETVSAANQETDLYRILDAAANRVREGVRVLEDVARFARDNSHLTSLLKTWRHDFRSALKSVDDRRLLSARDTAQDVGTALNTPTEGHRQSFEDVLTANAKRVQEGLRTLEEFGKILSPNLGEAISQLRYRFYTLEKIFAVQSESQRRLTGRAVYLLITKDQCRLDPKATIQMALDAGADVIQLREKKMSDRDIIAWGEKIRDWTQQAGALFIMNDRPDLAVLLEADGVHVGQDELTVRQARRIVGPNRLVGVSTHSIEQARQAVEDGADYLGVGPVFSSHTKTFSELAGLEFVQQVAAEIPLPWYAIGGITLENLEELQAAGAHRIAISHAVCGSEEPAQVVKGFKTMLVDDYTEA